MSRQTQFWVGLGLSVVGIFFLHHIGVRSYLGMRFGGSVLAITAAVVLGWVIKASNRT